MALPPGFSGINFQQWQSWPTVNIDGFNYYQIPGQSQYVFDPYDGANGTIKTNGKIVQDSIDAKKPKQPGAGQQIAQGAGAVAGTVAGTAGGVWAYNGFKNPWATGTPAVNTGGQVANGTTQVANGANTAGGITPVAGNAAQTVQPTLATPEIASGQVTNSAGTVTPVAQLPAVDGSSAITPVGTTATQTTAAYPVGSGSVEGSTLMSDGTTQLADGTTLAATPSTLALAAGALSIAGGLYGGYQTANYIGNAPAGAKRNQQGALQGAASGAAIGAGVGTIVPGIGNLVGAGVGALVGGAAGLAGSYFGSHKDKYQQKRDQGRQYLKQAGLVDDKLEGTLADGSTYNFGHGGNLKDIDFKDPVTSEIVAQANLIAAAEGFVGQNLEAQAGIYAAAALSNANGNLDTAAANIQHFAQQRGMTSGAVQNYLQSQLDAGQLDEDVGKVSIAKANTILPPDPPAGTGQAPLTPVMPTTNDGNWHPGMPVHKPTQSGIAPVTFKSTPPKTTLTRPGQAIAKPQPQVRR